MSAAENSRARVPLPEQEALRPHRQFLGRPQHGIDVFVLLKGIAAAEREHARAERTADEEATACQKTGHASGPSLRMA
jgi:hypothetical protein